MKQSSRSSQERFQTCSLNLEASKAKIKTTQILSSSQVADNESSDSDDFEQSRRAKKRNKG